MKIESNKTYIDSAGHKGRGVFAVQAIPSCEVIEIAPVLVITGPLCQGLLSDYVYDWSFEDEITGESEEAAAIGLGHTSLYNMDDNPNAAFDIDLINKTITISALRDIALGEEITILYRNDTLKDELVEICQSVAYFKLNVRKNGLSDEFQEDILRIQKDLHQLALNHLPEVEKIKTQKDE